MRALNYDSPMRLRRYVLLAAMLTLGLGYGAEALASAVAGGPAPDLDVYTMGMGLLGGLALFLFGMEQMADGLKAIAADKLKDILAGLTSNRYLGAITGAVVTAIIQSSSVTTVLVVGFITAGIMSLSQAVGVIFGSNIGSTVTAQLIAFKVTKLALLMVAVGFGMLFISKTDRIRHYGGMIMGLGLVFFGMSLMSDAMKPLRTYQPFLDLMVRMESPVLGILVGTVFTGLVQSSAATTGIVIAMAGQGLIALPGGIALVFGANIGTCVTALLASLGKPRAALRASVAHIMFNVIGVLLWVWFIEPFARFVISVSPTDPTLVGAAKMAADTPRQVANAHTIFNVVNTILFLPIAGQFARLVEFLVPEEEETAIVTTGSPSEWTTMHLDPDIIEVPSIALEQARMEILRLSGLIRSALEGLLPAFRENDIAAADRMLDQQAEIDYVGTMIDQYLLQISRRNLSQEQSEMAVQLTEITTSLERIGAVLKRDIQPLIQRMVEDKIPFSEAGSDTLAELAECVFANYDKAVLAFEGKQTEAAREVIRAKSTVAGVQQAYRATQYEGLSAGDTQTVHASEVHLDLADFLRRVYNHSEAVAFTMLEGFLDRRGGNRRPKAA